MAKNKGAEEKTAEKKKKKGGLGFLSVILLLIFLGSLGACGYLVYGEINKELGIQDMESEMQTFVKPAVSTPANDEDDENDSGDYGEREGDGGHNDSAASEHIVAGPSNSGNDGYVFDWDGMLAQSDYVVGWIQVPGLKRINYPIVQHPDDNQFFLKHDWKGNSQSAGAIFLNRYNSDEFSDMNSVIYGHRMRAGSMFGTLKQYASQSFMDENPYFYIYTPDGKKRTYEIVCYSSVTDGSDAYLMYFNSPEERMAYYDMMIYNAVTKRDVELNRFDTTVMLSTCNSTGYYDRLTLLGKLVAIDLEGQPENWENE